ncbi:helix-turn-helix domain-containing protein [Lacticaseibacillus absianus]|uniref:helix-turn-helix domain-containing protein n=1 Tax=Lacticaseibacillus absianus TaxID=2729623 RepID=UPI0015CE521E
MIRSHLAEVMAQRQVRGVDLAAQIGLTEANLSILKNDRAKAIRFSTLTALCRALDCQPGDLLEYVPDDPT